MLTSQTIITTILVAIIHMTDQQQYLDVNFIKYRDKKIITIKRMK